MLKYFKVDPNRHKLYVDVEFYQMGLKSVVDSARQKDPELFVENGMFLPSWSKFAAYPVKAKGFFTNMLQAVFLGQGNDLSLNVDFQTNRTSTEGKKVAMMFLPGSTTNDNLKEIKHIAEQALRGFQVVLVSGAENITNASAEQTVKEAIEKSGNNPVLILSAGMAQRSFSVSEITELYLAYDSGDNGATIQKMSRALTPSTVDKIGRVISLSFDPNRDDKFDAMIIETAKNYKQNHKIKDLKQALRDVLKTVDIFKCAEDGAVKIEVDTYLEEAISRNSVDRLNGKISRMDELSAEEVQALASGNIDIFKAAKQESAEKGKTKLSAKTTKPFNKGTVSKTDLEKAREMIVTIAQNIDVIRYYGGNSIEESFALIDADGDSIKNEVSKQFGVDYELIRELVLSNFINRDLLDLKFS